MSKKLNQFLNVGGALVGIATALLATATISVVLAELPENTGIIPILLLFVLAGLIAAYKCIRDGREATHVDLNRNYNALKWWAFFWGVVHLAWGIYGWHLSLDVWEPGPDANIGMILASVASLVGFWLVTLGVRWSILAKAREQRLRAEAERLRNLGALGEK